MARQKIVIKKVKRSEAEKAFEMYSHLAARLEELECQKNKKIEAIKKQYETKSEAMLQKKSKSFEMIHNFAKQHPELFEKKKSVHWGAGAFGYRTGMPKLKTCNGLTWDKVLDLAKIIYPDYVRTVELLNKDLIIADRDKLKSKLLAMGLEVIQEETFFVQSQPVRVAV